VDTLTWLQILQVVGLAGAVSAVVSALITGGVKEFLEWRERQRKVRYLALRIALVLEAYYHACADRIADIENFHSSRGAMGSNDVGLPDIPAYPADSAEWTVLDPSIVDEVLSLPTAICAIDDGIAFSLHMDFSPDGPDPDMTLGPLYEMAFRSIALARRVRPTHGLSEISRTRESEFRLRERHERFLQAQAAERQESRYPSSSRATHRGARASAAPYGELATRSR
jgi:hypothetical protein